MAMKEVKSNNLNIEVAYNNWMMSYIIIEWCPI
jgi:hypothetical protein